jgi:hypothetical protein
MGSKCTPFVYCCVAMIDVMETVIHMGCQHIVTVIEIVFYIVEWVKTMEMESITLADHIFIIFTELHPGQLYM